MSRLTNQPCVTCKEDTLHKGLVCIRCGTIVDMKRSFTMITTERAKRMSIRQVAISVKEHNDAKRAYEAQHGTSSFAKPDRMPGYTTVRSGRARIKI